MLLPFRPHPPRSARSAPGAPERAALRRSAEQRLSAPHALGGTDDARVGHTCSAGADWRRATAVLGDDQHAPPPREARRGCTLLALARRASASVRCILLESALVQQVRGTACMLHEPSPRTYCGQAPVGRARRVSSALAASRHSAACSPLLRLSVSCDRPLQSQHTR